MGPEDRATQRWDGRSIGHVFVQALFVAGSIGLLVFAAFRGAGPLMAIGIVVCGPLLLVALFIRSSSGRAQADANGVWPESMRLHTMLRRGFRKRLDWPEIRSIQVSFVGDDPFLITLSTDRDGKYGFDVSGRSNYEDPEIGRVILRETSKRGLVPVVEKRVAPEHYAMPQSEVPAQRRAIGFLGLLLYVVGGVVVAIPLVMGTEHLTQSDRIFAFLMGTAALSLFLALGTWAIAVARTLDVVRVEGSRIYLPGHRLFSRRKCWIPTGDVILMHDGDSALPGPRIQEVEAKLGRHFSTRERDILRHRTDGQTVVVTTKGIEKIDSSLFFGPARPWGHAEEIPFA